MKCKCGGVIFYDRSVADADRMYCCICGKTWWEFPVRPPTDKEIRQTSRKHSKYDVD